MPNIIGEPFRKYVRDQINVRQKTHGSGVKSNRTPEQITYLNSKTSWVKMASGIKIGSKFPSEAGIKASSWATLAKQYVLFSGTSKLSDGKLNPRTSIYDHGKGVYDINLAGNNSSEFGLVPMPGIISADIKSLNRGSIKKATVNIKCYSPEQFRILDVLYLRIGYTMFIEWGWSSYLDGKGNLVSDYATLIESKEGFFNDKWKKSSHMGFLPQIEYYRAAKEGNYDGLLCKVTNFSWTFSQDGTYDIQIDLISLGDVIESLSCNVTPPSDIAEFVAKKYKLLNDEAEIEDSDDDSTTSSGKTPPGPVSNFISTYFFIQKLYLIDSANSGYWETNDCASYYQDILVPVRTKFIERPSDNAQLIEGRKKLQQSYSSTEQLEELIKEINNEEGALISNYGRNQDGSGNLEYSVPYKLTFRSDQGDNDFVYFSYNTLEGDEETLTDDGFYVRFKHLLEFINNQVIFKNKNTDTPIISIDTNVEGNKMYTFPYQVSLDPRVCIVKNEIEPINSKKYHTSLPNWKVVNGSKGYGKIMNIYLNCNMINGILSGKQDENGNIPVFEVLQSICTELNRSLGGVNNLEPIVDEETQNIRIIDASYSDGKSVEDYLFELYGYNPSKDNQSNFVRNFSIKTEITNDFATMATVGSTAGGYVKGVENTMFSKWNRGLIDIFKEEFIPATTKTSNKDDKDPATLYVKEFWNKRFAAFGLTAPQDIEDDASNPDACAINGEIIDKNIATVTEFYKYCSTKIQQETPQYASPSNGFIPINLSLTFDGLSGIKIYNAINVDTKFLPKNYPNALKFIIKGVSHKISGGDWETTIDTITISEDKLNGKKIIPYSELKKRVKKLINSTNKTIAESTVSSPQGSSDSLSSSYAGASSEQTPLPTPAKSETNSKLEKQTKESAIAIFQKLGSKAGLCGGYTYKIAEELARKLTKKDSFPGTGKGGNNAYSEVLRTHLNDLGIYTAESLKPVGTNLSVSKAKEKVNSITKLANYGDALVYFATPAPQKGDNYKFHAQIYTGNQYDGTGWSTSTKNNYGTSFVYGSTSITPWTVYWFRIKDEYKDLPASNQPLTLTPEDSARAFNNLTYQLKQIYSLKDNYSNSGNFLLNDFLISDGGRNDEEGAVKRIKEWFETDGPQYFFKQLEEEDKKAFNEAYYKLLYTTKNTPSDITFDSPKNKKVNKVIINSDF